MLLNVDQQQEMIDFALEVKQRGGFIADMPHIVSAIGQKVTGQPLTEIREGDLYLCLEHRYVSVHEQEISLTVKEFAILALLITNPKRVFTYELITDLVWNEDYTYYSRKAINNHVSNLRKKLRIRPGDPNYIKTVTGIGYKFALP